MQDINVENQKRLSWNELYFSIAELVATRSKDPNTKVGAVLVKDGCVIGIGYNGESRQFNSEFNWHTSEKYDYVIHAEMNAVSNACRVGVSCIGADIYVTHSPCPHCLNILIQHGIINIYYKHEHRTYDITKKIAKYSNINLIQMNEVINI